MASPARRRRRRAAAPAPSAPGRSRRSSPRLSRPARPSSSTPAARPRCRSRARAAASSTPSRPTIRTSSPRRPACRSASCRPAPRSRTASGSTTRATAPAPGRAVERAVDALGRQRLRAGHRDGAGQRRALRERRRPRRNEGDAQGFVVLTPERRAAPDPLLAPRRAHRLLATEKVTAAAAARAVQAATRRGRPARVDTYRYPDDPSGARAARAAARPGAGVPRAPPAAGGEPRRGHREPRAGRHGHATAGLRRQREPPDRGGRASAVREPLRLRSYDDPGAGRGRDLARPPASYDIVFDSTSAGRRRRLHVPLLGRRPRSRRRCAC